MINLDGLSAGLTLFLWSAAVTPLFLAIQEVRSKNALWAVIYIFVTATMVMAGLFWPKLPFAISSVLSASSAEIFSFGSIVWSVIYAIVRRRWVVYGDRRLISGIGEGVAVFVFATMILLPFLQPEATAEILSHSSNAFIIIVGGMVGLILVWSDHDRVERQGREREDSK